MDEPVKTRSYTSAVRARRAEVTRAGIRRAATTLFLQGGYPATTMAAIATSAGVALDTVYASVGSKPVLFRLLIETAISGTDEAVPAVDRDYVRSIRAASAAADKLRIYAAALRRLQPRLAPLVAVLQQASGTDAELADLWRAISTRRFRNMRLMADDLIGTGQLRAGLERNEIADMLWSTNSPELFLLFTRDRRWTHAHYERWLLDCWQRILLAVPPGQE